MTTITLNVNLEPATDTALRYATKSLGTAIRTGFDDPVYSWPGVTKRRSGEVAGSPRNVVDLGALRDSQTEPIRLQQFAYALEWTAPYANAVFLGAVGKGRKSSIPARNVPKNVLNTFDLKRAFLVGWEAAP